MEWGAFTTVIIALYLAWYGFNFLFDLFVGGRPKIAADSSIHYDISELMGEENEPQVVNEADYEEKSVAVHPTQPAPQPKGSSDILPSDSSGQTHKVEPMDDKVTDWADFPEEAKEVIGIPVQGQPVSVVDFIHALKQESKIEAQSITF